MKKPFGSIAKRRFLGTLATAALAAIVTIVMGGGHAVAAKTCNTPNKLCGSELIVFDWGGSDTIGLVPDYAKKYPEKPRWSLFLDTNEGLQKMKGGFQVDIAHLTNSDIPFWNDFIQPWDVGKVAYWKDMYPFWKTAPGIAPVNGKVYAVPTYFGMNAAIYDERKIKQGEIKSLKDFADPKYKNRLVMPDAGYEAYAFCMLALGIKKPFVKITKPEIDTCSAFLRQVHKNVRVYFTDSGAVVAGFKTGELWLGFVWMDVPYTINKDRAQNAKAGSERVVLDRNLGFVLWTQAMVLNKNSKPEVRDLAYDYLNALTAPGGANFLLNEWGYGSTNKKAMEAMDPKILKERYLDNLEGYVASGKALMFGALPVDIGQYMLNEWEKIKSGQ